MFVWIAIDSLPGMWAFAAIYGLVTANIQSLTAPCLMSAGRDPAKIGAEIGMIFALLSIGMLCGPPIAGVLIEQYHGHYLYAQVYAGCIIMCGSFSFAAARLLCTRQILKKI
jgi:MFS family permease